MRIVKDNTKAFFVNKDNTIEVLPCFFAQSLIDYQQVFKRTTKVDVRTLKVTDEYSMADIAKRTVFEYLGCLKYYLDWVENHNDISWLMNGQEDRLSLSNHHLATSSVINFFLNEYLIKEKKKSLLAVERYKVVLDFYYNYLGRAKLIDETNRDYRINPELKDDARSHAKKREIIKYISPAARQALYQIALIHFSLRDCLLLRTAGEQGLRATENTGLVLNDFYQGDQKFNGLLSLFELIDKTGAEKFEFLLQGKFSKSKPGKGGASRTLKISRSLLTAMKDYFQYERPESDLDTLFVNLSNSFGITPINTRSVGDVFRKIKVKYRAIQAEGVLYQNLQQLDGQSYHSLRHSAATDFFHDIWDGREYGILPSKTAIDATSSFLGHTISARNDQKVTSIYIRSVDIRESIIAEESTI